MKSLTFIYYYLTNPTPGTLEGWGYVLLGVIFLLLGLAVGLRLWLKKLPTGRRKKPYRQLASVLANLGFWTGVYVFLRYERVPFLSMRLWYALFLLGILVGGIRIIRPNIKKKISGLWR